MLFLVGEHRRYQLKHKPINVRKNARFGKVRNRALSACLKGVIELKIVDLYSFKKATKTCKLDK